MPAKDAVKKDKNPILVPVDFSPYSVAALVKANELAECTGQPLVILHVVHDPGEMPGYYREITKKKKLARIEDLAKEAFDAFLRETMAEHPEAARLRKATSMLVIGLPANRILEIVDETHASMVVMGSQGRTGLDHFLLGSKAEQIVRLCPIPVLIVKTRKHA